MKAFLFTTTKGKNNAQNARRRRENPHTVFRPRISRRNDRIPLRQPVGLVLAELIIRNPRTTWLDPASLVIALLGLAMMSFVLELRCESLVANKSCARGTLQIREFCIKAISKAVRV